MLSVNVIVNGDLRYMNYWKKSIGQYLMINGKFITPPHLALPGISKLSAFFVWLDFKNHWVHISKQRRDMGRAFWQKGDTNLQNKVKLDKAILVHIGKRYPDNIFEIAFELKDIKWNWKMKSVQLKTPYHIIIIWIFGLCVYDCMWLAK